MKNINCPNEMIKLNNSTVFATHISLTLSRICKKI